MYLILNPTGSRWWRLDYRFAGKRKTLSMGAYPDTGLKDARERRDAARKLAVELAPRADELAQRKLTRRLIEARLEAATAELRAIAGELLRRPDVARRAREAPAPKGKRTSRPAYRMAG